MGIFLTLLLMWSTLYFEMATEDKKRARPRSYERYIANSKAIIAAAAGSISGSLLGTAFILEGEPVFGAMLLIPSLLWGSTVKNLLDDDDWFNKTRSSLKRRTKKTLRRFSRAPARRAPQPSPA